MLTFIIYLLGYVTAYWLRSRKIRTLKAQAKAIWGDDDYISHDYEYLDVLKSAAWAFLSWLFVIGAFVIWIIVSIEELSHSGKEPPKWL